MRVWLRTSRPCLSNQVLLSFIDSLDCQYNSIKLMSRLTNDPSSLPIRIKDITVPIPPSRIQLYRPVNPELTPLRQNKSDIYRHAEKEENIISPFQKDQFLNEYDNSHIQRRLYGGGDINYGRGSTRQYQNKSKNTSTIPQVIKLEEIPLGKQGLSKSWTNHHNQSQHRETVTYLEQIINDLSDKKQFQLTRRYIQKLQNPHLRQKLETVVSKLQQKESSKTAEFITVRETLTKILRNYFKYERSIELASTQRLLIQLQKAISKQVKDEVRVTRKQSQQKVKQMKEESKLLNSKLQRQTKELYKALEQEKSKMKESYEQIYRRIYEENNKLKKEFQAKEAELRQEKAQAQNVKTKYQSIFNEISLRFNDVKLEYGKLIYASSKQTEKNKDLKQEIRFINEKLRLQELKAKQLQAEVANQTKKYGLLEDEKQKLEQMSFKYKDYAEKFLAETKKYQNQRFEREKVQSQLKEVQNISIKKNEQQQQYTNDLQVNIKANQEILTEQLQKIREYESIHHDKVRILQAVLKETKAAEANATSYHGKIQKLKEQQTNLQQLIRNLNENRKEGQEKYARLQEKQFTITKMINNHEQTYIKLNQETKFKEKVKQNLQREITVINEEILSKKQKILSLMIEGETHQVKNRFHTTELNNLSRQIQSKETELNIIAQNIASKQAQNQSLEQKLTNIHLNLANLHKRKEHLQTEESSINHKINERNSTLLELNNKITQRQATLHQSHQELANIQKEIEAAKTEHIRLQQTINIKTQELTNLEEVFTGKKDLMESIQSKLMQLEQNIENLEKSNETTAKQEPKVASQPALSNECENDSIALELVRKSLQYCIQSLKSQKTKTSQELQSLRQSLRSHEEQFTKKDKELQKISDDLDSKYMQYVIMDEHLLTKKKQLQALE